MRYEQSQGIPYKIFQTGTGIGREKITLELGRWHSLTKSCSLKSYNYFSDTGEFYFENLPFTCPQIGFNLVEIGIAFSVLSVSYVLGTLTAGRLSDKFVSLTLSYRF